MELFPMTPAEEIRLRVASVTAQQRAAAARRAFGASQASTWQAEQSVFWGEPLKMASRPAPRPRAQPLRIIPKTVACSVFALAAAGMAPKVRLGQAGPAKRLQVTRDPATGSVRCVAIREQDTEEWQERERQRRARQKPPKPVRAARTRGKKLIEMTGGRDGT